MEVTQYKMQYLAGWELTIPSQLNSAEVDVVREFLNNKHISYVMERDRYYTKLKSACFCTITPVGTKEIKIAYHLNKPIICKITD